MQYERDNKSWLISSDFPESNAWNMNLLLPSTNSNHTKLIYVSDKLCSLSTMMLHLCLMMHFSYESQQKSLEICVLRSLMIVSMNETLKRFQEVSWDCHPDENLQQKQEAHDKFVWLNDAYQSTKRKIIKKNEELKMQTVNAIFSKCHLSMLFTCKLNVVPQFAFTYHQSNMSLYSFTFTTFSANFLIYFFSF